MMRFKNIASTVLLIVLWVFPVFPGNNRTDSDFLIASTVYAGDADSSRNHVQRMNFAPIEELIVTLVTRTGATDQSVAETLRTAAATSTVAFRETLKDHKNLRTFANGLERDLSTFRKEYPISNQSSNVISARAAAVDKLFRNFLTSADKATIPREKLELAVLSAFSDLQEQLSAPPLASSFTDIDRELANLLMLASVHQIHRRSILDNGVAAVSALNVDQTLAAHYTQTVSILDASLLAEMTGLERSVADPTILQNSAALVTEQYNIEAINDLFWLRYQLELYSYMPFATDVMTRAVSRMNDVGGIMSGVTVTDLMQSGVARSIEPYWSLFEIFVYDWIRPEKHLRYRPIADLAEDLLRLGGSVPVSPDFTLYTNPYLAIFQLKYDFDLCNEISALEWNQALNASTSVLMMSELRTLRLSEQSRLAEVLSRLRKVSSSEKRALATFFMIPR